MNSTSVKKPKNVIWIFGDQHRGQALSCAGDPNLNTPNIDRLAVEGQRYPNAVAGFPLCCPFRGSLLTSRYPHKCVPAHEHPLPTGARTLAHAFGDAGYRTAWFGKWHLSGFREREGRAVFHRVPKDLRGGFDTWLGYENNNAQWDCHVHGHDGGGERDFERLPGYETDSLTDLLIDYLEQRGQTRQNGREEPFFAALSVQPPHNPYTAPPEFMARHNPQSLIMRQNVPEVPRIRERARRQLAGAYAMIENLDCNLGRIVETLRRFGLEEDTYILFFSDHGDLHGSHGQFHKTAPWQEAVSIPLVVSGGGSRYDHACGCPDFPVNHVDIAPTTLGLCGIEVPEWMEGFDYSGFYTKRKLRGEPPDSAFLQSIVPTGHGDSVDRPWRGLITRDGWKYVCLEGQPWLLFNLNEDPFEQVNLAHNSAFSKPRKNLQDRLRRWLEETDDREFTLPSF